MSLPKVEFLADHLLYAVDFANSADGWTGGFADYPVGTAIEYHLEWGWRLLPPPLRGHGFNLAGTNRSDDLFMFMKRRVTGLRPVSRYLFVAEVTFATDAPTGCAGVGGAPGESVFLKAGVSPVEPVAVQADGYWRMNIDKGDQAKGGADAAILGNVANTSRDCASRRFEMKTLRGPAVANPVEVPGDGSVWLIFGSDSGYESMTSLYYVSVSLFGTPI